MADPNKRNRLSPPLMYIFRAAHAARDAKQRGAWREDNGKQTPSARSRALQRIAITEKALRNEVSRDIEALMNCVSLDSTQDLTGFEAVKASILNYGFPDIAHRSIDELDSVDLDGEIQAVLQHYEPRLAANSLRVVRDTSVDPSELKVRYVVSGELLCEPLNVPIEFVADVEVASGKILINRL